MKKIKVAINGCGRIGRAFLKVAIDRKDMEIVAVNDLASLENIAYLLKYDSAYGKSGLEVSFKDGKDSKELTLIIDGKKIVYLNEPDPTKLPWKKLNVDVVVESTGFFASYEKSKAHLDAGAKKVVISAPVKDLPTGGILGATVLMGINEKNLKNCDISSNASCTTNAASPLIAILCEKIGIEKAVLNTVHGYTVSQALVDSPSKRGFREGRAAAQNIVPSSTGAAVAVTLVVPELKNNFDGIAMRVPVITGSIVDITFIAKRNTTKEEVNDILKKAAKEARWKNIFITTEEEIVSTDIEGNKYPSIADLSLTRVIGGNLVKVLAWYDNEMGYSYVLADHVAEIGKYIKTK